MQTSDSLATRCHRPGIRTWELVGAWLLALCLVPHSGAWAKPVPPKLAIEIIPSGRDGTVSAGEQFTVALRLVPQGRHLPDDLVAIISGPQLATRLSPFDFDAESQELRTDVDVEAPIVAELTSKKHVLLLTCLVAQRRGGRLKTLTKRMVYLTIHSGSAGTPAHPPHVRPSMEAPVATRIEGEEPPPLATALTPAHIEEQLLLPITAARPSPAFWRVIKGRILQRVRALHPATVPEQGLRQPTIHFRLYAKGTVQSIHLDPTSGDPDYDQALLQSVFDAQPFPPFPDEVTETHLDVHLTVPHASGERPGAESPP